MIQTFSGLRPLVGKLELEANERDRNASWIAVEEHRRQVAELPVANLTPMLYILIDSRGHALAQILCGFGILRLSQRAILDRSADAGAHAEKSLPADNARDD